MKYVEQNPSGRETVVLLHGGNVAGWMWGEQLPAFAGFHVLVPDLPGFGASHAEEWISIADAADRVAELIADRAQGTDAAAPHPAAHIVGLSLGSSVALALAARHPESVRSLFLASAPVVPPPRTQRLATAVMLTAWNRRWFWAGLARSYGLPEDSRELFVDTGLAIRVETARSILAEVVAGVPAERLKAISAPTLAVAGERDAAFIRDGSLREIARSVPGARTATAPGMHHQWNIENVELFNAAALAWIERGDVIESLTAQPGTNPFARRE